MRVRSGNASLGKRGIEFNGEVLFITGAGEDEPLAPAMALGGCDVRVETSESRIIAVPPAIPTVELVFPTATEAIDWANDFQQGASVGLPHERIQELITHSIAVEKHVDDLRKRAHRVHKMEELNKKLKRDLGYKKAGIRDCTAPHKEHGLLSVFRQVSDGQGEVVSDTNGNGRRHRSTFPFMSQGDNVQDLHMQLRQQKDDVEKAQAMAEELKRRMEDHISPEAHAAVHAEMRQHKADIEKSQEEAAQLRRQMDQMHQRAVEGASSSSAQPTKLQHAVREEQLVSQFEDKLKDVQNQLSQSHLSLQEEKQRMETAITTEEALRKENEALQVQIQELDDLGNSMMTTESIEVESSAADDEQQPQSNRLRQAVQDMQISFHAQLQAQRADFTRQLKEQQTRHEIGVAHLKAVYEASRSSNPNRAILSEDYWDVKPEASKTGSYSEEDLGVFPRLDVLTVADAEAMAKVAQAQTNPNWQLSRTTSSGAAWSGSGSAAHPRGLYSPRGLQLGPGNAASSGSLKAARGDRMPARLMSTPCLGRTASPLLSMPTLLSAPSVTDLNFKQEPQLSRVSSARRQSSPSRLVHSTPQLPPPQQLQHGTVIPEPPLSSRGASRVSVAAGSVSPSSVMSAALTSSVPNPGLFSSVPSRPSRPERATSPSQVAPSTIRPVHMVGMSSQESLGNSLPRASSPNVSPPAMLVSGSQENFLTSRDIRAALAQKRATTPNHTSLGSGQEEPPGSSRTSLVQRATTPNHTVLTTARTSPEPRYARAALAQRVPGRMVSTSLPSSRANLVSQAEPVRTSRLPPAQRPSSSSPGRAASSTDQPPSLPNRGGQRDFLLTPRSSVMGRATSPNQTVSSILAPPSALDSSRASTVRQLSSSVTPRIPQGSPAVATPPRIGTMSIPAPPMGSGSFTAPGMPSRLVLRVPPEESPIQSFRDLDEQVGYIQNQLNQLVIEER